MQKRALDTQPGDVVAPLNMEVDRYDEMSLINLWLIIRRRRLWLLAGALAGFCGAVMYAIFATPTYESRASVQIGKVHEFGPIEDVDALAGQLTERYGVEARARAQHEREYLKQATKVPGQNGALRLIAVGRSPEDVRDFVAGIVADVLQRHGEMYAAAVKPFEQRLAVIDKRVATTTKRVADMDQLVDRFKDTQPLQASILLVQQTQLLADLNRMERERLFLLRHIVKPYSQPTVSIADATLPNEPFMMNTLTTLAIAMVLGLMLGIVTVFFAEFVAKLRAASATNARAV